MFFIKPLGKSWFTLIYARPGNCKSLEQARISFSLFMEYHYTEWRYPTLPKRILLTNQILNKTITDKESKHGHLLYWDNPEFLRYCPRGRKCYKFFNKNLGEAEERHSMHDVDILIDEGASLFPADGYKDTPMWMRKLWSQHRHNGIRIVMLTQDYRGIDINIRRMLWTAYHMTKVCGSRDISPTLPPLVKWTILNFLNPFKTVIWGLYYKRKISPTCSISYRPRKGDKILFHP